MNTYSTQDDQPDSGWGHQLFHPGSYGQNQDIYGKALVPKGYAFPGRARGRHLVKGCILLTEAVRDLGQTWLETKRCIKCQHRFSQ